MPTHAQVRAALKKHVTDQTPAAGNKCKDQKCRGEVVRRVTGLFRGRYSFSIPECKKCGRLYRRARLVRTEGLAEFRKRITTPITI